MINNRKRITFDVNDKVVQLLNQTALQKSISRSRLIESIVTEYFYGFENQNKEDILGLRNLSFSESYDEIFVTLFGSYRNWQYFETKTYWDTGYTLIVDLERLDLVSKLIGINDLKGVSDLTYFFPLQDIKLAEKEDQNIDTLKGEKSLDANIFCPFPTNVCTIQAIFYRYQDNDNFVNKLIVKEIK